MTYERLTFWTLISKFGIESFKLVSSIKETHFHFLGNVQSNTVDSGIDVESLRNFRASTNRDSFLKAYSKV